MSARHLAVTLVTLINLGAVPTRAAQTVSLVPTAPVLGTWAITVTRGDGSVWMGTLKVERPEPDSGLACEISLQQQPPGSGGLGFGSSGRWFPGTRRLVCAMIGESSTSVTAVLAADQRQLTQGEWTTWKTAYGEDGKLRLNLEKTDTWTATRTDAAASQAAAEKAPAAPPPGSDAPRRVSYRFDPRTLQVKPEEEKGGQVVVVTADGGEKQLFQNVQDLAEATRAAELLRKYGVNEVVEITMPGVVESIYLKSGRAPAGKHPGEECRNFDPATLAVTEHQGSYESDGRQVSYTQWTVADSAGRPTSGRMVLRFNEKPFAEELVAAVRQYGLTHRCRAGGFWYFRR